MTTLVVLTVIAIVALIAVLAIFLYWVGVLLSRIADNLDDANESVKSIVGHAKLIGPGVEHINRSGKVVASRCRCCTGSRSRSSRRFRPTRSGHRWRSRRRAPGVRG